MPAPRRLQSSPSTTACRSTSSIGSITFPRPTGPSTPRRKRGPRLSSHGTSRAAASTPSRRSSSPTATWATRRPRCRLQALLLASEALWWLHHYADAQLAAETALRAHPGSTQALWRLIVAHYKEGHFEEAQRNLDSLLAAVNTFAPAWSLRGQTKVWQAPDKPAAGGSDFEAAHELDSTWPVPVRLSKPDFQKLVDEAVLESMADMRGAFQQPVVEIEMLPGIPAVARGSDPDIRCTFFNPSYAGTSGPLSMLGGDFASGARRDIAPGAGIVLYQRNIENLCGDPGQLRREVTKSFAEALAGSLRIDATAIRGAAEVHAEDSDMPGADQT